MSTKHKFGVVKTSIDDITKEDMTININSIVSPPSNDNEEVLYIDPSNNLMLTTLNYTNTKETLLKGMLE
jgi:hypothetical protein